MRTHFKRLAASYSPRCLSLPRVLFRQVRLLALKTLLKACKPGALPVSFVARALHFNDDDDDDDEDDEDEALGGIGGIGGDGAKAAAAKAPRTKAGSGAAKCVAYLRAAGVSLAPEGGGQAAGGGGEVQAAEEDPLRLEVDTKASSARPLELEALLAWEGLSGSLL